MATCNTAIDIVLDALVFIEMKITLTADRGSRDLFATRWRGTPRVNG